MKHATTASLVQSVPLRPMRTSEKTFRERGREGGLQAATAEEEGERVVATATAVALPACLAGCVPGAPVWTLD